VRWDPKNPPKVGDTVTVVNVPGALHLFDTATGNRIN
jgi:multiple sugar transport system ATP-binding protein